VLLAAAVFGCDREAAQPEPAAQTAQARPGEERRAWRPANEQARGLVGAVAISADPDAPAALAFAFAQGVTVRAAPVDKARVVEEFGSDLATLQAVLGAPADVRPWLYRVSRETVSLSAEHGGLCGGLRATHLVAAEFVDSDNAWTLRLASFHRAPNSAARAVHCFSFDFSL